MPDDPKKPADLDQDRTFMGEQERVPTDTRSLGAEATRGDAGDSSSDDIQQALDAFGEVVDLAKRYDVQDKLGAGGMGTVHKAIDKRLGRTVALKFLLSELTNSAQAFTRFMIEAKAIATLNHINIVQIHEMERSVDGPYIVMEYVEGGSLVDALVDGPMELETAVDIICQICDGLGVAHAHQIIHRDIKPANILMTNAGVPKLSDFGLARQTSADHGQTQVGAILGTIDFMPPEQRQGAELTDHRSDLWSLAATLYQMITGSSPKVIRLDQLPANLAPVIGKMLEEDPEKRYQTAGEFKAELRKGVAAAAAPVVDVDLGSGECPACHAKNEPNRKFCRGCGETLIQSCFSCHQEMPVWEQFCGDCGGDQRELFATRRAELDAQRTQAESLRSEFTFDESIQIAGEISHVEDGRLQHLKEWSETFIVETTAEKERQEKNAADRYGEAIKHHEAFDYTSAINTLETVPVAMRNASHSSLLKKLRSDLDESEQLIEQIKSRLTNRTLEGLLDLVNRAVELRGDRKDLHNLQAKLLDRSAKQWDAGQSAKARPYAAAIDRLGADNFVECPLCLAPTKAKNILAHFDKVHSDEWPLVAQVENLKIVADPMLMPTVDTGSIQTSDSMPMPTVDTGSTQAVYTATLPAGDTGTTQAKSDDWEPNGFVVFIALVLLPWLYYGSGMLYALGAIVILGVVDGLIGLGRKKNFSDQVMPAVFIMVAYGVFVIIVVWLVRWIWSWFF
jgi:hypothetical protein